ncbi:MAG: haloacid dehalogenase [Abditibacteriota bacterium]|nr:haloacid dehalogenase [Abditibacteriota bacterium]
MFENHIEKAVAVLDNTHNLREEALKVSRETIRFCANSIRASHRREFDKAEELLREAGSRVRQVKEFLADKPEIYYTGYVLDAQKEYGEAVITNAIIRDVPLPGFEEIGIEPSVWLNSLAEAASEARRFALDELRTGNIESALRALEIMDEVYYRLISVDYPDAVTGGLRRHTDQLRGVLEKTRSDITLIKHQQNLSEKLDKTIRDYSPC